jgi:hypothetical protein
MPLDATREAGSLPLPAGQDVARRPFLPVRSRVRADDSAVGADPARAERRHRHSVAMTVPIQYSPAMKNGRCRIERLIECPLSGEADI